MGHLVYSPNCQVPFEVLVRRQIARLLDPSLQCARFIYDELIKVCIFVVYGVLLPIPKHFFSDFVLDGP